MRSEQPASNRSILFSSGLRRVGIVAAILVVIGAVMAFAAPVAGNGTYRGTLQHFNDIHVSFRVYHRGHRITHLRLSNLPLHCQGGGSRTPIHFRDVHISGRGFFRSEAQYVSPVGPTRGTVVARLIITGRFGPRHHVAGTLTTAYPGAGKCGGKDPYTAANQ